MHDDVPVPPVPPIPHPEDVAAANERIARAMCPVCQSEGALVPGETLALGTPMGMGAPRPVRTRVCRVCGHIALFVG